MNYLMDFVGTELFTESPADCSAEEAALSLTTLKDSSAGPNSCYFCKRCSDALINFGSFHSCKPCMKKATLKSDKMNASFPFIHQETTRSKVQSYAMESPGFDEEQSADGNSEEAEDNDSDEANSSSMDVDNEKEAGGYDSDGANSSSMDVDNEKEAEDNDSDGADDVDNEEEPEDNDSDKAQSSTDDVDNKEEPEDNDSDEAQSSMDDVDNEEEAEENHDTDGGESFDYPLHEEEGGDDIEAGNTFGRDSALTTQEALNGLLATIAKRPQSFEAMSVFQETIKYTVYQPFDTIQPFHAGRTKYYVSPLVRALLACVSYIFDHI